MSGAFAIFPKGLIDEACDRVRYLLAHEPILRQWNAGGVIRSRSFGPVPGVALPHTTVSAVSVRSESRPGGELLQLLPIGISIAWEEFVSVAEEGENSAASAVAWIHRTLYACPYLDVPELGGDRIAERLDNLEPVSLARGTVEGDESRSTFALTLEATYQIATDLRTWTRFASPTT